jgi:hypothetical protein
MGDIRPDVSTGEVVPAQARNMSDVRKEKTTTPNSSSASAEETSRAFAQGGAAGINAELMRNGNMGSILRDLEAAGAMAPEETEAVNPGFDASIGMAGINAVGQDQHLIGGNNAMLPDGHREPTNDNLPVVMHQTLMASGDAEIDTAFDPKWHQIQNLPGYVQQGIRQVGRQVFQQFTTTPIEEIQMLCDLLNPPTHVRKMAEWIYRNGVEEDAMNFDFREHMPAYAAMAGATIGKVYRVGGYQFFIMKDNGGHYIYGWAANDPRITGTPNQAQLESASKVFSKKDKIESVTPARGEIILDRAPHPTLPTEVVIYHRSGGEYPSGSGTVTKGEAFGIAFMMSGHRKGFVYPAHEEKKARAHFERLTQKPD